MPIARVVPLRRLPTNRPWFDYQLPEEGDWRPGQLVEIPFLKSHIRGIIWRLVENSSVPRLKAITRLLQPQPVVTNWQRRMVESLEGQTFASLGHILDGVVPMYSTRESVDRSLAIHQPRPRAKAPSWPDGQTWWYRSRLQAEEWLISWLSNQSATAVIITPTIEDAERLIERGRQDHVQIELMHGQLGRVAYRSLYERVRLGQITRVIGPVSALFLPYPESPSVVIDQEEHPSHKSVLQHPRFDLRPMVAELKALAAVTTPSPSVWWWHRAQPTPPPTAGHPRLASLDQPSADVWLTPEVTTLLDQAAAEQSQVALIVPRRGYAGSVRCRQCGLSLTCPVCHHAASLQGRPPGPLNCQYCSQRSNVPTTCPRCQGVDWQLTGLGPERMADMLGQRWTHQVVENEWPESKAATAIIGTYQLYRSLLGRTLAGLVIIHGDALRNVPDFSAEERAWQYLARVQSVQPACQFVVQTFRPADDFWQRWKSHSEQDWYSSELSQRRRLALPPVTDQWIARLPASDDDELQRKKHWLVETYGQQLSVSLLPPRRGLTPKGPRLLISSPQQPLASLLDGPRVFPTPWQVETIVTSWLD